MTSRADSAAAETEGFEHHGVFFHSARDLRETVIPVLRTALAAGENVVVAVSDRLGGDLRSALGAAESSAVRFADRTALYDAPGRTVAALHRLARAEPRRVTVIGEPVLPPDDPLELREWHRLDAALVTALSEVPMRLVCLHDGRTTPADVLRSARDTHPVLLTHDGRRTNPDYRAAPPVRGAAHALPPPAGEPRRLDIHGDLPALRREVRALGAEAGLPAPRLGDLVVAVNELTANVLEHGAGKGTITVWSSPGRIVCEVFDECGDLTDPLCGYHPADPLSPRGYGLWITRQVCDFMEVTGGTRGSLVRMYFRV
ncbi:anti-sigma regulatory factor (Ser/Thr protein kinase) [Nocardiopsis mwathae]|uniref:Anti-sigma regulatory factor (Ser/Thr protein kinase) n=1 Tax=Nocardiopsis mwathae TaxID=1472723 RepID=A0A7W9YK64_9ACTN|nr:sensor histidine kinase [Nocardiopsis mwathae]MBB6173663.1 anti-sigma regulatory factor (Ser/Thr protein kinase) [Nocardiopsis mwathae]